MPKTSTAGASRRPSRTKAMEEKPPVTHCVVYDITARRITPKPLEAKSHVKVTLVTHAEATSVSPTLDVLVSELLVICRREGFAAGDAVAVTPGKARSYPPKFEVTFRRAVKMDDQNQRYLSETVRQLFVDAHRSRPSLLGDFSFLAELF